MRVAIKMAWEHGGADFQSRYDKTTGQAQEMKEGALRAFCEENPKRLMVDELVRRCQGETPGPGV
jgi:hypothetical protein